MQKFGMRLTATDIVHCAWQRTLADIPSAGFQICRVHAPICSGASSFPLSPLQLRGSLLAIGENTKDALTCHYTATDGSCCTFNGNGMVAGYAALGAGLRGIAYLDAMKGLPELPLQKLQTATGEEAEMWLCVSGVEPFGATATGNTFTIITRPCEDGHRVISFPLVPAHRTKDCGVGEKPPRADVRF